MTEKTITLFANGTRREVIPLVALPGRIPNVWKVLEQIEDGAPLNEERRQKILDAWHIAGTLAIALQNAEGVDRDPIRELDARAAVS